MGMKAGFRRHRWTILSLAGVLLLALWIGSYVQLRRERSIDHGSLLLILPGKKTPLALAESWRPLAEVDARLSRKSICLYGAFNVGPLSPALPDPDSTGRFHIGATADF